MNYIGEIANAVSPFLIQRLYDRVTIMFMIEKKISSSMDIR